MFAHGADIFVKDHLLSGRGTAHLREPPQVGRPPIGPAHVTDSVSEQEGCETELGILAIADGVCTRAGEIANGFICHLRDLDRGEIPRAGQSGQLHGVPAVGCHPIPRFLGEE